MSVTLYTPDLSKIIHETKVDFRQRVIQPIIHIVQYDKSLPIIAVKLYNNGIAYALPENADVSVRWGKRDHTFVYNAVLGCNSDRTIVYFEITEQMTVFYGEHNPIIELRNGTSLAGSGYIPFYLDRNPIQVSDIKSQVESGALDSIVETKNILWADLVALRDASELIPGRQYRITDYVTTTTQADTQSAGHQFDIIVTADDVNKLNENARATHAKVTGDELLPWFEHNQSNPAERYFYVDSVVIEGLTLYRWVSYEELNAAIFGAAGVPQYLLTEMRDVGIGDIVWGFQIIDDGSYERSDYGSDATIRTIINVGEGYMSGSGYFANSKLEAWKLKYCLDNDTSRFAWADNVNGKGVIYQMVDEFENDVPYDFKNIQFKRKLTDGQYDPVSGDETWVYTFSCYDTDSTDLLDATLVSGYGYNEGGSNTTFTSYNKIDRYTLSGDQDYETSLLGLVMLNDIVFIERLDLSTIGQDFEYRTPNSNNKFAVNCYSNTFGNSCSNNAFGSSFSSNTFGAGCSNNTFGAGCNNNTFGNGCASNTFEDYCNNNTFVNGCNNNTFGNYFNNNTFGTNCSRNIFGNNFTYSTFGNSCSNNTFGNYCNNNTFGNGCNNNTFGNSCYYLQISDNTGTVKNYISVDSGTIGVSSINKFDLYDSAILNKNYQVTFKKSASGKYLMLWATDTGAMTGKVKDSNIDTTWADIV